jgi:cytochrome P450
MRALGHSVLGVDLGDRTQAVGAALRIGAKWATDRAMRPINTARWMPARGQRRARAASAELRALAAQILSACRADPTPDAPLVRALIQTLWEDPLCFDPDRFSPERSEGRDRWQYLPFGAGPRACIGDHFAMLEATLALATILRRVEIDSESPDFPTDTPLTMVAAAPVRANVESRADRLNQRIR